MSYPNTFKHLTFLEIHFTKLTKLAKLTNVHASVFYIRVQYAAERSLCNKVCSNVLCKNDLECILFVKFTLVYFLQSTSGCKMYKDALE